MRDGFGPSRELNPPAEQEMTASRGRRQQGAVPPWRDVRVLRATGQIVIVALIVVAGYLLWTNFVRNMAHANLTIGLDFLRATAGFDISQTIIPYTTRDSYGHAFLAGLLNTLMVSAIGIVLATVLGVIVGVARLSTNWLVNRIATGYVEVMRNTPLLVQLVLIYAVFLQLPTIAESVSLPGGIFLNQRGLFVPRPVAEPSLGMWLALVVAGVGVAWLGARLSSRRR